MVERGDESPSLSFLPPFLSKGLVSNVILRSPPEADDEAPYLIRGRCGAGSEPIVPAAARPFAEFTLSDSFRLLVPIIVRVNRQNESECAQGDRRKSLLIQSSY